MRRFGVIVCPDCHWARAVDLGTRTMTCLRCGKRHALSDLKVHARSDHVTDLSEPIGRLNERYKGKGHRAARGALGPRPASLGRSGSRADKGARDDKVPHRRPTEKVMMELVERLCARKAGMTLEVLREALRKEGLDPEGAEVRIQALLGAGIIYEPEDGVYRMA